jgi:hypothetical protein
MATDYEHYYDHWRDEVADYSTSELVEEIERLEAREPHLSTDQLAKEDAIFDELEERDGTSGTE